MAEKVMNVVSSMADKVVHITTDSEEAASPSLPRTLLYTKRGLKMVGEEKGIFDLDEPKWDEDDRSPTCDKCHASFTFTHRRHHCRRCGIVMCSNCSEKSSLTRMGYVDPVLVCKDCAIVCRSEEDFFQHHLKTLINGASFTLSDSPDPQAEYFVKLSPDHKQIIISDDRYPINMRQILEVKTISGDDSAAAGNDGRKRASSSGKNFSLEIVYRSGGIEQKVTFSPPSTQSRKLASEWLRALKKGLIILHSNK